jgi:SAM-dependent methyltransferase
MSLFSSVDTAPDPERAVAYLELIATAQRGMKHYATAAHARWERRPRGFVLDLGCGAGHDLALLGAASLDAIGIDPSGVLLDAARRTSGGTAPLVRATGESLPFSDASLSGCRIERVLQHVADPGAVLAEVARCVRPGALLTVFEPDWSTFRVRCDRGSEPAGWISGVRHPGIGGSLWDLVERAGFDVLDRVEELSVWRSLAVLDRVVNVAESVERAVGAGRIGRAEAEAWLQEQRDRERRGGYYSTIAKIMIVAVRR